MKKQDFKLLIVFGIPIVIFLFILMHFGENRRDREINDLYMVIPKDSMFTGIVESAFMDEMRTPKLSLFIRMQDDRKIRAGSNSFPPNLDISNYEIYRKSLLSDKKVAS